jgi:hypothetical protein
VKFNNNIDDSKTASRIFILLFLIAAGLNFFLSTDALQVFASYGKSKKVVLPICYFLFSLYLATRQSNNIEKAPRILKLITTLLAITTLLSITNNLFSNNVKFNGTFWLQGVLQLFGFILFILTGVRSSKYTIGTQHLWIAFGVLTCFVGGILGFGVSPFIISYLPFATYLMFISAKLNLKSRVAIRIVGTIALTATFIRSYIYGNISSAWLLAFFVNIALLLNAYLPRRNRKIISYVASFAILFFFLQSSLLQLLLGRTPNSVVDVTLVQRSFEAKLVMQTIGSDLKSLFFGLGPGGYLDMTWAPDYRTLASAGRDLHNVDDAHFLTSWILLKVGIFGLLSLGILVVSTLKAIAAIFHSAISIEPLDFLFASIFLTGLAISLTAGTNFFTNPLLGFSVGIISCRAHQLFSQEQN